MASAEKGATFGTMPLSSPFMVAMMTSRLSSVLLDLMNMIGAGVLRSICS